VNTTTRTRRLTVEVPIDVAKRVERAVQAGHGMTLRAFLAHQLATIDAAIRDDTEPDEEMDDSPPPAGYL